MGKINTILVDFDGTLADTNGLIYTTWEHVFEILKTEMPSKERLYKSFGETMHTSIASFFPEADVEEVLDIYRNFQIERYEESVEIFEGMKELIEELKAKKYKVGLVTSRLKNSTMIGLRKFGMAEMFDVIITANDCEKHKPDPEPILTALEKLGSLPEESLMIGDTRFDVMCAKNSKAKSVLVGWAVAASEEDKTGEDAPDYIIKDPKSLLDILEQN